jgi:hypothetical protein
MPAHALPFLRMLGVAVLRLSCSMGSEVLGHHVLVLCPVPDSACCNREVHHFHLYTFTPLLWQAVHLVQKSTCYSLHPFPHLLALPWPPIVKTICFIQVEKLFA